MAYIHRTNGTATNELIWTFSCWLKKSDPEIGAMLGFAAAATNTPEFSFTSNDYLQFWTGSSAIHLATTAVYKDPAAWYHVVLAYDSTQVTSSDRVKMYVNGVEPALTTSTYPSSSYNSEVNKSGEVLEIGKTGGTGLNGVLSHVHFIDGIQYTASDFGETDATSGIWKLKTSPSVTYGNNGFFLKMEDRTNLDLDSSPNAHTMTTSGTLTATYDNPSDNFCTMNPLEYMGGSSPTFSNGNNTYLQGGSSQYYPSAGTVGLTAGKWYWEVQTTNGANNSSLHGITGDSTIASNYIGTNNVLGFTDQQWGYYGGGEYRTNNGNVSYGAVFYGNIIIGVYLDLDNNKLYFARAGAIQDSGTGISITATSSTDSGYYVPSSCYWGGSDTFQYNFGNGYLGTTAVTSAVADAGGIGAFEYDPSDGGASSFDGSAKDFRAICTKNIKAYGG